jgi:hypothetical protein
LHGIDQPQAGFDADSAEVLDIGRVMRLQAGLIDQKLDFEDFAVR